MVTVKAVVKLLQLRRAKYGSHPENLSLLGSTKVKIQQFLVRILLTGEFKGLLHAKVPDDLDLHHHLKMFMDRLNDMRNDIRGVKEQQDTLVATIEQKIRDDWTFKNTVTDKLEALTLSSPGAQTAEQFYGYLNPAEGRQT